ncbi:MAG: hypothetical protein RBU30_16990 [Polyangia bacterium]|jgi:hypothetical protein|nr:hypothetical protein [Polyangia bacterium]
MKKLSCLTLMTVAFCLGPPASARNAPIAVEREPDAWTLLPWRTADGVGRVDGREADSRGPGGFAVSPDGVLFVLDSVNARVLVRSEAGAPLGEIPLTTSTFEDMEQVEGRALVLLDRQVGKALLAVDLEGRPLAEVPLDGPGIERPGLVTAILPRADGVWLEVAHSHSVLVLGPDLSPCPRRIRRGRPGSGGESLHGALGPDGSVRLWRTDGLSARATKETTLRAQLPARRIVWLDQADTGEILAVLETARFSRTSPFRVTEQRYEAVWLDEGLTEISRFSSPWVLTALSQRGEIRVTPEGSVLQMAMSDQGALVLRWEGRAP